MTSEERTVVVPWHDLFDFTVETLEKVGMARHEAEMTADTMVVADLRGIHSHGVMRLPVCVKRIESGAVRARSEIRVIRENRTTALIDRMSATSWGPSPSSASWIRGSTGGGRRRSLGR